MAYLPVVLVVCVVPVLPHTTLYCTPAPLQSQNSCLSPISFPDLQLAGDHNNASSAGYCEESELEDEVRSNCTGNIQYTDILT